MNASDHKTQINPQIIEHYQKLVEKVRKLESGGDLAKLITEGIQELQPHLETDLLNQREQQNASSQKEDFSPAAMSKL